MISRCFGVVLLVGLGACQAWHPVTKPSAEGALPGAPELVRVTRTYNCSETPTQEFMARRSTVTLYSPRVQGDSLVGYFDAANNERTAMHLRDVVGIESKGVDAYRTVGATLGIGALIGVAVLVTLIILVASLDN